MSNLFINSAALVITLYLVHEFGGWLARNATPDDAPPASGVVFAVFGLLIAFTFTNSAQRFDERRELVVQHANALSTSWSRLDLLPDADREAVRRPMLEWLDLLGPMAAATHPKEKSAVAQDALRLQQEAWDATIAAVKRADQPALGAFLLTPQNEWADLTTLRRTRGDVGLPPLVLATLIGLALLVALVAGYGMTRRGNPLLLHKVAFTIAIGVSLHVIIDLNAPRAGLIRVDGSDHILQELREVSEEAVLEVELEGSGVGG